MMRTSAILKYSTCALLALIAVPAYNQQEDSAILPGSVVYVDVYRRPELSTTAQVDLAGNVTLPYVGSINIAGLDEAQASALIAQELKRILRNPRVSVSKTSSRVHPETRAIEMKTEFIELKNSSAEAMAEALRGMSSEGGAINFHQETNTLVITDTADAIAQIMNAVERLDQTQSQRFQVQIATKIADVKVGAMKELGLKWFLQEDETAIGYSPFLPQDPALIDVRNRASTLGNEDIGFDSRNNQTGRLFVPGSLDRRLAIPINVPNPGQMFIGYLGSADIGAILDALVSQNKAEMLGEPVITTVNHEQGEISSLEHYPYTEFGTEVSGRANFSVRFLDAGISLKVTPHVYEDDGGVYVKMELEPEMSFIADTSRGIPVRSSRTAKTTPLVRDGQTFVIGGIFRNESRDGQTGVPGLSKVPLIKNVFRRKEKVESRTELVVFVTPHVFSKPEAVTWDRMLNLPAALADDGEPPLKNTDDTAQVNK